MLEFRYNVTEKNVGEFKGSSLYGKRHEVGDKFEFIFIQHEENGEVVKLEIVQLFESERKKFLSEYTYVEKKDVFCVFKKKEM